MLSSDRAPFSTRDERHGPDATSLLVDSPDSRPFSVVTPGLNAAGSSGAAALALTEQFEAVAGRLSAILDAIPVDERSRPSARRIHTLALECAAALGRLREGMTLVAGERDGLERELNHAKGQWARALLEAQDSQAGELDARHQALHDDLTSLPNRRHCQERLAEALGVAAARHTQAGLLYLDLDGFKEINDHHGHATGDAVLRIVAARLNRALRAGDVACRLGGDEFACLPAGPLSGPQLARLARKLIEAVSAPLMVNGVQLRVRPSIGVAIFPTHADDAEALFRVADAAMYRAKQQRTGFAFGERAD
ncbi:diguanylate cyclase domain-containing protein [Ideonella sp. YS5]|uniref:diguanylate cyclase domain-containing protein n=1 Tax=Ideonella sp. YS5 TaxID=3453714 RepID=UPI003EE9576E